MKFSIKFETIKIGWLIVYIKGFQFFLFPNNINLYFFFSEDRFFS